MPGVDTASSLKQKLAVHAVICQHDGRQGGREGGKRRKEAHEKKQNQTITGAVGQNLITDTKEKGVEEEGVGGGGGTEVLVLIQCVSGGWGWGGVR